MIGLAAPHPICFYTRRAVLARQSGEAAFPAGTDQSRLDTRRVVSRIRRVQPETYCTAVRFPYQSELRIAVDNSYDHNFNIILEWHRVDDQAANLNLTLTATPLIC